MRSRAKIDVGTHTEIFTTGLLVLYLSDFLYSEDFLSREDPFDWGRRRIILRTGRRPKAPSTLCSYNVHTPSVQQSPVSFDPNPSIVLPVIFFLGRFPI
jgi:hypothetical protein